MIPLTANIPLALCSIVLRRFIESYAGRLPLAAPSSIPSASTLAVVSGALACLYHQLRKGTLVKIGLKKGFSSILRNSRHTIQRRVKNNSWFLRNIDSCRRKCTEAVFKILQPSKNPLEYIQVESGAIQPGIINGTASLPMFNQTRVSDFRKNIADNIQALEKIYSNDSFGSEADSAQEIQITDTKKEEFNRKISNPHRPLTRHFRKSIVRAEDTGGPIKKSRTRKRGKTLLDHLTNEAEDDFYTNEYCSEENSPPRTGVAREESKSAISRTRNSRRLKKQPFVQKITRKTRSGRVYVYRL